MRNIPRLKQFSTKYAKVLIYYLNKYLRHARCDFQTSYIKVMVKNNNYKIYFRSLPFKIKTGNIVYKKKLNISLQNQFYHRLYNNELIHDKLYTPPSTASNT